MDRVKSVAVSLVFLFPLSASAGTFTNLVQVDNGLFNDADLTGFSTWTMRVEADTDWTNADLRIELTSGTLNHVAPAFLGSPNGVNGFGDTAGMAPTNTLGSITNGFNGVVGFAGDHIETPTLFQSSWFTTEINDIGVFDIAMFTLSHDAIGSILYRTISGSDVEEGGFTSGARPIYRILGGRPVGIPEPTTATLLLTCCALPAVVRRRRYAGQLSTFGLVDIQPKVLR